MYWILAILIVVVSLGLIIFLIYLFVCTDYCQRKCPRKPQAKKHVDDSNLSQEKEDYDRIGDKKSNLEMTDRKDNSESKLVDFEANPEED